MRLLIAILVWLNMFNLKAQVEPIDTDRPDQTESAVLVPHRWIQFEAGFNFQKNNATDRELLLPTLLSKYGLTKRLELRLITTMKSNSTSTTFGRVNETGLDVAELGVKISLCEEQKLFPKTSLIFHLGIPAFASKKFKPDKVAPNFRFTMQHSLTPRVSLGYNLGCEWDGFTADPAYIYTLTIGFVPHNKWYTYLEGFGGFKNQLKPEHNFDGGIAYYFSANLKSDISAGVGLTNTVPAYYIALGISMRFNTCRK